VRRAQIVPLESDWQGRSIVKYECESAWLVRRLTKALKRYETSSLAE
jgi:hypothetical protein